MTCCDYDCHQGRDCPARNKACKHCHGLGYDASGQKCGCTTKPGIQACKTPPPITWRHYLRDLWMAMLYTTVVLVIAALALGLRT